MLTSDALSSAPALRLAIFCDTYSPQVNGVARTLERLVDAVRERGASVRVFTTTDPAAEPEEHVQRFPSLPFWAYEGIRLSWPSTRAARHALRQFRPTLVHAATPFGVGLAGRRAALTEGVPLVTSYHTQFTSYAQFYRLGALVRPGWRFLRWFHNSGRRTYCPTLSTVDELRTRGFTNTAVWSRGVDAERFSPRFRSMAWRQRLGANDSTLVVTYVGRLAAEKGLHVAAHAVRRAAQARPGRVVFACIGDGPIKGELKRLSPDKHWFPGVLDGDALSEAYASSDVFIFPSTTDTFGNVVLEAMASGLPVLAADVNTTRELVGDERGWLARPNDPEAFAARLVALVDDRTLRQQAGQQARAFAMERSWTQVWERLIADYLTLHRG
jgi:phosphatidylinositol alpha 1,6-mannosyltransferase